MVLPPESPRGLPRSSHVLPLAYTSCDGNGSDEVLNASATLVWADRTFVVTAAHVVHRFLDCLRVESNTRVWLGNLELGNLEDRVISLSHRHDLATLAIEPSELALLGDEAAFYNPRSWPPRPVMPGERIQVMGFPRDQWPAMLSFEFEVESATDRRFGAVLQQVDMPACLRGLSGAPAFRASNPAELVGVIVESLFHNEVVRAQHVTQLDPDGRVHPGPSLA